MGQLALLLSLQDDEEPQEGYERLLFEDKQFFAQKALVPAVWSKRLAKMSEREAVYRAHVQETWLPQYSTLPVFLPSPLALFEHFRSFQNYKQEAFRSMFGCTAVPDLLRLAEDILQQIACFLEPFSSESWSALPGEVKLGQEPDPMLLWQAMRAFSEAGAQKAEDLFGVDFPEKQSLLLEFKRLSLLAKMQ